MATIPFPGPETRVMIMNEKAQAMPDDTDDTEIHPLFAGAPSSTEFRKLRKRLVRETRAAIEGINGILLLGWSTAFFVSLMARMGRR